MTIFFYYSYALIEYLKDNPRFTSYFEEHQGIITIFNLVEVYYSVLSGEGKTKADIVFEVLHPLVVEPSSEVIKKAMFFRLFHKKRKLSYADCVGYETAREKGIRFLTGDEQFRQMEYVEFVK